MLNKVGIQVVVICEKNTQTHIYLHVHILCADLNTFKLLTA